MIRKKLSNILDKVTIKEIVGDANIYISDISQDSRNISTASLFAAIKGERVDGHNYIEDVVSKGVSAVLCEKISDNINKSNTTFIVVENTSYALGVIASNFFDNPSEKINLTGITGTNGKTTTVTLLYQLFENIGYKSGLISTIRNYIHNVPSKSTYTTPDVIALNSLLKNMVDSGCKYCFMEVSSHAIAQNRIAGLDFNIGLFSNLTHDHLDYHKDFKTYRDVKKLFFDNLSDKAAAISNVDDPNGMVMLQNTRATKYTYGMKKHADYKGVVSENTIEGLSMRIGKHEVFFNLIGRFNAYNLLAVYAIGRVLKIDELELLEAMSSLNYIEGRFDIVNNAKNIYAIVDYAHTPDALENILSTIDELRTKNEQLIVVIGAGGNRDKLKRPVMAKITAKYADKIILTSDNPRDEDPLTIIEDMKKGLDSALMQKTIVIPDRYEAIKTACVIANEKDIVLVAGKGHETEQEIRGVRYDFDDKKVLTEILKRIED